MAVQDPRYFAANGSRQAERGVGNTVRIAVLERRGGAGGGGGGGGGGPPSGAAGGFLDGTFPNPTENTAYTPQFGKVGIGVAAHASRELDVEAATGIATVRINAVTAATSSALEFANNASGSGTAQWTFYRDGTSGDMYMRDSTNSRTLQGWLDTGQIYHGHNPGASTSAVILGPDSTTWTAAGTGLHARITTDYAGGFSSGTAGRNLVARGYGVSDEVITHDTENGGAQGLGFTTWAGFNAITSRTPYFQGTGTYLGFHTTQIVADPYATVAVTALANSGGLVKVTATAHGLITGDSVTIDGSVSINTPTAGAGAGVTNSGGVVQIRTAAVHGLTTGDWVRIVGASNGPSGMTTTLWQVTVTSTTTFTLDGSVWGASTAGGHGNTRPLHDGTWQVTYVDADNYTLNGSTWVATSVGTRTMRKASYREATGYAGFMTATSAGSSTRAAELDVDSHAPGRSLGIMISMTRDPNANYEFYNNAGIFGTDSPWLRLGDCGIRIQNSATRTVGGTGLWINSVPDSTWHRPICVTQGAGTNLLGTDIFTVDQYGSVGVRTPTTQTTNPTGYAGALTIGYTSAAAASTSSADGINFGGDIKLYRSGTAALTVDHSAATGGAFSVFMPTTLTAAQTAAFIGASPAGNQSVAINASGGVRGLRVEGGYTITGEPNTQSFVGIQVNPTITLSSTTTSDINNMRGVTSLLTVNPTASTTYTNVSSAAEVTQGFRAGITLNTASGATQTIAGAVRAFDMDTFVVDTGWTVALVDGVHLSAPTGAGTITTLVGVDIDDLNPGTGPTKTNTPMGIRSNSPILVSNTVADTLTNVSVGIELDSTTRALLVSRMTAAQVNALTAADGMVVYVTDAATPTGGTGVGPGWYFRDAGVWTKK